MWRYLIPIALFAVLAVFFARGLNLNPGYVPSPLLGKPAPSFELPKLKDPASTIASDVLVGETALFNVWATWCVGCRQEHAFLNEVAATSGLPIYGLNWKDDRAAALNWLATLGDPYTASGFDEIGEVAIDWGVYGAPETFLISRNGTVLYKHIAPLTAEVWEQEFIPRIEVDCGAYPCR
ncbi:MAG: DsbE family thiol:disulfide interchange protein [Gammaproteobacteria bacterium]|nr:DsbE family thiol:disulfide interchange protein [Gammaproteobacteria bacterium]MDH3507584.1 DsbE family thiol:disulfide interchange protein [Gammaproteobacteria bacterium]